MIKILVFGWYGHGNVGDQLFCEVFKKLFPEIDFTFTDNITLDNIKNASAIFIGGGSFLSEALVIEEQCLNIIKTMKIFYVGVGAETDIHPLHQDLIKVAKLIALRSTEGADKIKALNNNVIIIPDLVYHLNNSYPKKEQDKSILIVPNINVVPQNGDPHWKYNAWSNFKFEFSQFLDWLVENEFKINFLSMCNNDKVNDSWAASEIISSMKYRKNYTIINNFSNPLIAIKIFSMYDTIITQRYHGIILSELVRKPFISIHHHNKLKESYLNEGKFLSYFASAKQEYIDNFKYIYDKKIDQSIAIESDMFKTLRANIINIMENKNV